MANVNNPHGLRSLNIALSGGPLLVEEFDAPSTYATTIYQGDVLARAADASVAAGGTPGTTLITGVSLNYGVASTARRISAIITPDAIFEAQDKGASAGIAAADIGLNANLKYDAGSTTTKQSGHTIDDTTQQTTATLDVHLLKLLDVADNAAGQYARVEIVINKHRMNPGVAGV
jgi:hypothetical protein